MKGGFWTGARKTGRSGFFKSDAADKAKNEGPQQLAQNKDKLKKDKDDDEKKDAKKDKKD